MILKGVTYFEGYSRNAVCLLSLISTDVFCLPLPTRSINIQYMFTYIVGKVNIDVYELRKYVEKLDFEALFWSMTKDLRTVFDPFICTQTQITRL